MVPLQQMCVGENTRKYVKFNRGPQGNVGIRCEKLDHLGARIVRLIPDGPALTCGKLAVGDVIESVDGTSLASLSLDEICDHFTGQPGSTITLYLHSRARGRESDAEIFEESAGGMDDDLKQHLRQFHISRQVSPFAKGTLLRVLAACRSNQV